MQIFIEEFIDTWKSDYEFKTKTVSLVSAIIGIAYTIFNGFLGIYYSSIWNGTICVYYVLLAIVRAIINYIRAKQVDNILIKELRIINILDMMVSILILQNTLIIANSGEIAGDMKVLSIISSTAIWLAMLVVSIVSVNKSGD